MSSKDGQKKRFYKRWWFWLVAVVVVIVIVALNSGGGSDSGSSSTSAQSDNSQPSTVAKTTVVNFSDTTAKQTTKVSKATIKDVSDQGLTDDNGNDIGYALIINVSITNKAADSASSFPAQGHVILPNGTQLNAAEALSSDLSSAFNDGDIASGATVKGDVYFPISEKQAKSIKSAQFKFQVMAGDSNLTTKNYNINLTFK